MPEILAPYQQMEPCETEAMMTAYVSDGRTASPITEADRIVAMEVQCLLRSLQQRNIILFIVDKK